MLANFLVLALVTLAVGDKFIGPCRINVKTQHDFDWDKFTTENGGKWNFVKIPNTAALSGLSNLDLTLVPGDQDGQYKSIITSNMGQGLPRVLSDELIENQGNGFLKAKTNDGTEFNVYLLKYKPSQFAYYYICRENEDGNSSDYRYVLSHGPLSNEDLEEIDHLENIFNFKGKLKDLSIGYHN